MAKTMQSLLGAALLLGGLASGVPAEARHQKPDGWSVRVEPRPFAVKQGVWEFVVHVKDEAGRPVENANVHLRLHSFGSRGYRLQRAVSAGKGRYQAVARVHEGAESPRQVSARVTPAGDG